MGEGQLQDIFSPWLEGVLVRNHSFNQLLLYHQLKQSTLLLHKLLKNSYGRKVS